MVRPQRTPGAVLVTVALLVACCAALSACRVSRQAEPDSPPSVSGFSTLDTAGVAKIRAEFRARLDLRTGRLVKSAVGLADGDPLPELNTRGEGKIALSIAAPHGTIEAKTDRVRFNSVPTRQDISEVTYFLATGSRDEFFALIREGVEKYGVDGESAERWIGSATADPGRKSDFSLTSGISTGLEVNYDLRYDGTKEVQVIIVHVSPVE